MLAVKQHINRSHDGVRFCKTLPDLQFLELADLQRTNFSGQPAQGLNPPVDGKPQSRGHQRQQHQPRQKQHRQQIGNLFDTRFAIQKRHDLEIAGRGNQAKAVPSARFNAADGAINRQREKTQRQIGRPLRPRAFLMNQNAVGRPHTDADMPLVLMRLGKGHIGGGRSSLWWQGRCEACRHFGSGCQIARNPLVGLVHARNKRRHHEGQPDCSQRAH